MSDLKLFIPANGWKPAIQYEDKDVLIVEKPDGMLSVPGKAPEHKDSLQTRVEHHWPESLLLHRLDCATSGLMIFARHREAQKVFSRMFQERKINKTYIADVSEELPSDHGVVDVPLACDWPNRPKQHVNWLQGKASITYWTRHPKYSRRVTLHPITGRSHQLRVHMQWLGCPIRGDRLYQIQGADRPRLHLHAHQLSFTQPFSKLPLTITSPCPFEVPDDNL